MRNFLVASVAFFGFLMFSGQSAYAQCPVQSDVLIKTSTDVTCFGANDGTITVDLADASVGPGVFNFDLYDLVAGAYVTLSVTETENTTTRSVTYSNVPPGSYAVVFRKVGCTTLTITQGVSGFDITEPTQLVVTDVVAPDCNATVGVGNGKIDLTISGGTSPYTTAWSGPTSVPANTVSTAANLDAGSYTVTVRDANNCTVVLNLSVAVTTPADAGPATGVACGTASFALSGNAFASGEIGTWTGPPGVTFSPNANTPNATANNLGVGANVLTWTITDTGFVCTGSSDNITVTYSNVSIAGSANVALPCFGATTATGTFAVTGGIAPFTYTVISNTSGATVTLPAPGPTTSVNFTNGGAGVVTLQVRDNSNCTSQATITITQPASAVTASTTITNVTCNGGNDGSILVTPAGGTAPYDFSIDGGTTYPILSAATHTFTALTAQSYNLRVRDANGCVSTVLARTVTQPTAVAPGAVASAVSCFGGNNGSITVTPSGGVGPYDFSIDGGTTYPVLDAATNTFTGLTAGSYNIRVRDANNCQTAVTPVSVSQPAAAVTAITTPTSVSCFGASTGSILITPSGGVGPYDFSIDGGGTYPILDAATHTFSGLTAGSYNIRVRDANNCQTAVIPVTITQPAVLAAPTTPTNVTCFGAATGSILVSPTGGTAPYDFSIDGGTTYPVVDLATHTFNGLAAGTYNISVRDANNCIVAATPVTITQPASAVSATTTPANATCFGGSNGSILVTPSGGTSPYDFSIDGGTSYPVTGLTTHTFTGLTAQNYNIRVRDANGCQSTVVVTTVGQAADITFTPGVVNATCFNGTDGSITITPTGGTSPYDFSIDGGATYPVVGLTTNTFTGLTAQNYNLRVRDVNGCVSSIVVQAVTAPTGVTINTTTSTPASCAGFNDGTINVTSVTGGNGVYQYSNDNGATFQGSASFTGLAADSYDIVVKDGNNCTSAPVTQVVGSGLIYDVAATSTPASCGGANNGTVTVNSTTGGVAPFQYRIDGGALQASATFNGLGVGTHTVIAVDANGCASNPFDVVVGSGLAYDVAATSTPASCGGVNDGTVTVNSTTGGAAPFQYSIDGGALQASATFTGLGVGTHTVTAVDANGCSSNPFDVVVGSGVAITSTNTSSAVTVCLGSDGSINVTGITGGTAPYDISIDNGSTFPVLDVTSNIFTGLTAGNYNVVVRDNAGCLSTAALVTVAAPPGCVLNCFAFNVTTDSQSKRPTCNGGSDGVIALTISGPPGNLIVSLIPSTAPTVILPSGSTFVFSNLSDGSYQYSITDGVNVCVQSFDWGAVQNVQATLSSSNDSPCFGVPSGSAVIDATGSTTNEYYYSLDGSSWIQFVPGVTIANLPAGTYNIHVGNAANDPCFDDVPVTINELGTALLDTVYVSSVNGFPAVSYPESPTATRVIGIEESGAVPYEVRMELVNPYGITPNPPFIIDWTVVNENNPQSFIPQKQLDNLYAGEYQLSLRDALGCERTFAVIIGLDERVFIPNIFTPNKSDDLNSTFFVRNLPEKGSKLSVTDRWGKEVYSSNDYNPETLWDGGNTPDGVYYYRLQIKGGKTYTGWVEILRGTKP